MAPESALSMNSPIPQQDSLDGMLAARGVDRIQLQRRKLFLSVLGPVIILLSFLVKDVLRDHVEGQTSDFKDALTLLKQQSLLMDGLAEQIADVKQSVEGLSSSPQDNSIRPTVSDWMKQYDEYDHVIRELQVLHEDMPAAFWQKDGLDRIANAQQETSTENMRFDNLIAQLRAMLNPKPGAPLATAAQIQAKQEELRLQSGKVFLASRGAYQSLVAQITSAKDKKESLHKLLNGIGYVLFLAGWALTLLGSLFHIPELARAAD
jgi:hypothetical protein